MESEYESSRIERIKRGLYVSDDSSEAETTRPELTHEEIEVAQDWIEKPKQYHEPVASALFGVTLLKAMVMLAGVAAVGALLVLAYVTWNPGAKPSDKNIEFAIDLPVKVSSGAKIPVSISVNNHNGVSLEYAILTVTYPDGTLYQKNDVMVPLKEDKKIFDVIPPSGSATYKQEVVLLGESEKEQQMKFTLEYRFAGINSIFTKNETRPIGLSSSPINLTVDTKKEVNAGQTLDLVITASANTLIPLSNILLKVEYPQGFQYIPDATPKPTYGNSVWKIGTVNPGDKFEFRVRGVVNGEITATKVFKTSIGVVSERQEREIAMLYAEAENDVSVQQPFIGVGLYFDGKPVGDSVANFGQSIAGQVQFTNNLATKIINAQIEVKLEGSAFSRRNVRPAENGYFRPDDTIFWDERAKPQLAELASGETGSVTFDFLPLPSITNGQVLRNPTVTAKITVRGKRVSEAGVPEEIKTFVVKDIRLTSEAQLTSRAVYSIGPFANRGPIPPIVEQETSYTVIWSIVNTSNDLRNGTVRATLPPYVRWAGSVSPISENMVYDKNTNQVVWNAGNIAAGVGVGASPARQVAFQLLFLPSLSQLRLTPSLLTNQEFTAQDVYTLQELNQQRLDVNISLSSDPKFTSEDGMVTQ